MYHSPNSEQATLNFQLAFASSKSVTWLDSWLHDVEMACHLKNGIKLFASSNLIGYVVMSLCEFSFGMFSMEAFKAKYCDMSTYPVEMLQNVWKWQAFITIREF